jgi:YcxB-like protein
MTPITYALTIDDLTKASRLGMLLNLRRPWWKIPSVILVLSAAILGAITLWDGFRFGLWFEGFYTLLGLYLVLVIVFIIIVYFWMIGWRARKQFKQMPMLAREQHLHWDNEQLHFASANGEAHFPFTEIHKCYANKEMVLLYPADMLFYLLPRRFFKSQEQYDELVDIARNSGIKWM